MDHNDDTPKRATKSAAEHARQDRLGRALRENLKRRKAQARSRSAGANDESARATDADAIRSDRSD